MLTDYIDNYNDAPEPEEVTYGDQEETDLTPDNEDIPSLEERAPSVFTGDLSGFMADFNQPKEELGVDEEPTLSEMEESNRPMLSGKKCRQTAKFLTSTIDTVAALGLSQIDKEDYKTHKAEPEALKDLENILCEYLKEQGADIPLGVQLIICIFTLYVVQVPGALAVRKMKKEQEKLERAKKTASTVLNNEEITQEPAPEANNEQKTE